MNRINKKRPAFVGLFVIIGIFFLVGGILLVGNLHETFKRKIELVSLFSDVNGLKTGSNIWFSGVKIGTVGKINFYASSKVAVHFKIEKKVQQYIHKNATIKISSDGLIGNKIMIILGGSENYPEIEDGDTLLIEKTFSTEDMINILQANNVNMLAITKDIKSITHKLTNGEGSLGKLLQDENIFSQIQSTTNSLEKASENAEIIMSSLKQLTLGLNKKGTLTHELASDTLLFKTIKNTLFTLQSISDSASIFVANLKESSINPNTPIGLLLNSKEAGDQLKVSIKNLESSSIKLNQDLEAVQHSFLLRGYFKKLQKNKSKTEK